MSSTLEHIRRFAESRPKHLSDDLGYRWTRTKAGGARRGITGGWITVYEHRPVDEGDGRQGWDFCIIFANELPQRKYFGGTFDTVESACKEASALVAREMI